MYLAMSIYYFSIAVAAIYLVAVVNIAAVVTQLTKNVSGTFGFGCMKVWLNLTLLERNAYVRH